MLKGISPLLSPELLKALAQMGHGDELVLGDGNFPGYSHGQRSISCAGHGVTALLNAILPLFPLDFMGGSPAILMAVVPGHLKNDPPVWEEYRAAISKFEPEAEMSAIPRQDFYDRARKAYLIVETGETALYGNIILRKGVVV